MGLFRICAYQLVHSLPSVDTSRDNIRISRDNLFNFCFQKKKYHKCTQEVSSLVFTVCNHQKGTFQNSVRIVSSMDSYLPLLHIFTTCLYYMTLLLRTPWQYHRWTPSCPEASPPARSGCTCRPTGVWGCVFVYA